MAKRMNEGSVAPKERVNIRYKPAVGDNAEQVELPFKVMIVGDFTKNPDETPLEERSSIAVGSKNLDEVLGSMNVGFTASVDDKTSASGETVDVDLKFNSMRDFTPDAIVENNPHLKKLIDFRNAMKALKGPLGNVPAMRNKIKQSLTDKDERAKLLSAAKKDKK